MSDSVTRKVLIVGWDAADWNAIHPLVGQGKMPTLKAMIEQRATDESNPKDYWGHAPAKSLARDQRWLPEAKGKAVKVIAQRLPFLPQGHRCRVIFMERPLSEVLGSQQAMLERAGAEAGDAETLTATFQRHLDLVQRQLARRGDVELL